MITRALFLSTVLLAAAPALAATQVPQPIHTMDGKQASRGTTNPADTAPPAVPGARADTSMSGAATRSTPLDMPPTDALFDAINRGDLAAAKEAIGRGADIHGQNVLGLTPLELAIDLGRSNISFLLLSLRGNDGYGDGTAPTRTVAAAPTGKARHVAAQTSREQASRQQTASARFVAPQPRTARLFAGNGGAPVPQAGFLGFDATR